MNLMCEQKQDSNVIPKMPSVIGNTSDRHNISLRSSVSSQSRQTCWAAGCHSAAQWLRDFLRQSDQKSLISDQ